MNERDVHLDSEVVELLHDRPDLLAIADAISASQPHERPQRRRRRYVRSIVALTTVAAATVLALAAPWPGSGRAFTDRALAAFGKGGVIHVISVSRMTGGSIVDLATGVESPSVAQTEIWFDGARGLRRTVIRVDGVAAVDELETPQGAWTQSGRVYTCAWIAAHPARAARARVSCAARAASKAARPIVEPRPSLDPALAGFVDGYKQALARGDAIRDGDGVIDGRRVEWLRFQTTHAGGDGVEEIVERVAVDSVTLKPVRVETAVDGQPRATATLTEAEAVAPVPGLFSRPRRVAPTLDPRVASVRGQTAVSLAKAASALGGQVATAGASVLSLPLNQVTLQRITTGYGPPPAPRPTHSLGVELLYGGPATWRSGADYVLVKEARRPEMLYRFVGPRRVPPKGKLVLVKLEASASESAVVRHLWTGQLVYDGLYVSLEATSKSLLIRAAKALATQEAK